MMRQSLLASALLLAAGPGHAVDPEEDTPPVPTPTTLECDVGEVWDEDQSVCVPIEEARLTEPVLQRAARELAYADRFEDALAMLARSSTPGSSRVLTFTGLTHGRAGRFEEAFAAYGAALDADPDNLLARAYFGLALIAAGREDAADLQLAEIRARGGRGSWPDRALSRALAAGEPIGY